MRTLIVGAGIGGLTAAHALHRARHLVTVVDPSPEGETAGAGILLAPQAVALLAGLGVDVVSQGHPLPALDIVSAGGRRLSRIDTTRVAEQGGPLVAITRPSLRGALVDALPTGVRLLL